MNRGQLKADLTHAEGLRTICYDDATGAPIGPGSHVIGHPTIGIGHRVDLPLPAPVIAMLLEWDVAGACRALDQELPWWKDCADGQQRALAELTFNMGVHTVLTFARFLLHLKAGRAHAAGCELATSKWATQVGPERAQRIIDQLQA